MARKSSSSSKSNQNKTLVSILTFIFFVLAVVIAQLLGIDVLNEETTNTDQPAVEETTFSGSWYNIYFTNPVNTNDRSKHVGSTLESDLVNAINNAKQSIDVALFELDLDSVTQALINARARNVRVRIVLDNEYAVEDDGSTVEDLIDAGMVLYCGSKQPRQYDIRCDDRSALMHNKFFIIDKSIVWAGATNTTHNGIYNNSNNAIIIRSSRMAENYQSEFDEMFQDGIFTARADTNNVPYRNLTINGVRVETYFSPEDGKLIEQRTNELISGANKSVLLMLNILTLESIGNTVIERFKAGIPVEGIFETAQSMQGQMVPIGCAGIPVKQDGNPSIFHHKVIIIDNEIVITGSYNFSASARDSNNENVLIIFSPEVAQQYTNEFYRWYRDDSRARIPTLSC